MFNGKQIKELQTRMDRLEKEQRDFIKEMFDRITKLIESSKDYFVWELRQEEVELMNEGRKIKKIRKILN